MFQLQNVAALMAIALAANTAAHPGHSLDGEIAKRSAFLKHSPRDLSHCAEKLQSMGVQKRAVEKRAAQLEALKTEVAAKKKAKRALDATPSGAVPTPSGAAPSGGVPGGDSSSTSEWAQQVANTSHLSNLAVTPNTAGVEDIIFQNTSCILTPEAEVGPYYVLGELIREDITEDEPGVPVTINGQFIDVNTCEPIPELYWDMWHCNSTGVYGGIVADGNGNSADATNIDTTFLRGIAKTDAEGVATFKTVFPGHYDGRATHIHVVTHNGATQLANGTLSGGNVTHIGQLFFDQDLIDNINANVSPYTDNDIEIVDNADDRVFGVEAGTDSDPVFDYVKLGEDVEDGLFAWIALGVDTSASYDASYAGILSENGGSAV